MHASRAIRSMIFALCVLAAPLCARDISTAAIDVSAARTEALEQQVAPAFSHIASYSGLVDEDGLELTLVGHSTRFAEIARHDGVGLEAENVLGYAHPTARRVVLNLAGIEERRLSPIGVLRHELTHLVLGAKLKSARPLWFEEGICQWIEAVAMDALITSSNPNLIEPDFPDFATLERGLRQDNLAGFAYAEARRVIYQLERDYGRPAIQRMLQLLTVPGAEFDSEFAQAFGLKLADFEKAWQEERRRGLVDRIFVWIGANTWVLAFLGAAAVGAVALALRKRRGAKQIEAWEEQEKYFPSDPSWSFAQDDDDHWRGNVHKRSDGIVDVDSD